MNNDFVTGFEKTALNPFHAIGSIMRGTATKAKDLHKTVKALKTYAKTNVKRGKSGKGTVSLKDARVINTKVESAAKSKATRAAKKEADQALQEARKASTAKAQATRKANKQKVQDKIDAKIQVKKDKEMETIKGKIKAVTSNPIANVVGGGVAGAVLTKGLDKATSGGRNDRY